MSRCCCLQSDPSSSLLRSHLHSINWRGLLQEPFIRWINYELEDTQWMEWNTFQAVFSSPITLYDGAFLHHFVFTQVTALSRKFAATSCLCVASSNAHWTIYPRNNIISGNEHWLEYYCTSFASTSFTRVLTHGRDYKLHIANLWQIQLRGMKMRNVWTHLFSLRPFSVTILSPPSEKDNPFLTLLGWKCCLLARKWPPTSPAAAPLENELGSHEIYCRGTTLFNNIWHASSLMVYAS